MLETHLGAPILQLAVGKFMADSKHVSLAVLHPRALAVYSLSASSSAGAKDASYCKLLKSYVHALERPASSMVHGSFGGSYGHDPICIQSMDGVLVVVDQVRQLCCLPGTAP